MVVRIFVCLGLLVLMPSGSLTHADEDSCLSSNRMAGLMESFLDRFEKVNLNITMPYLYVSP